MLEHLRLQPHRNGGEVDVLQHMAEDDRNVIGVVRHVRNSGNCSANTSRAIGTAASSNRAESRYFLAKSCAPDTQAITQRNKGVNPTLSSESNGTTPKIGA